jgi:hypothetical protein
LNNQKVSRDNNQKGLKKIKIFLVLEPVDPLNLDYWLFVTSAGEIFVAFNAGLIVAVMPIPYRKSMAITTYNIGNLGKAYSVTKKILSP